MRQNLKECRVCQSNLEPKRRGDRYWVCGNCGSWNLVRGRAVEYEEKYYQRANRWWSAIIDKWSFGDRAGSIGLKKTERILEIGFGEGKFIQELHRRGFDVYGVDVSTLARNRLSKILGKNKIFANLKIKTKFDVVVMFHVLEHVKYPREMLNKIKKILNVNGKLVIRVPRVNSDEARWAGENWYHLDYPYHQTLFTDYGLKKMLKGLGFRKVEMKYNMTEYRQVVGYSLGLPRWWAIVLTPLLWCWLDSKRTYGVVEVIARC